MEVLGTALKVLGVLFIVYLALNLIKLLLIKKLTLSGQDLVRYLRQDDHMISINICPFCGKDMAAPVETEDHKFRVECPMCGSATMDFDSPEEALIAWNLRNGIPTAHWEFVQKEN